MPRRVLELFRSDSDWYQLMGDGSLEITFVVDATGKIVWASEYASEVLGYSESCLLENSWPDLVCLEGDETTMSEPTRNLGLDLSSNLGTSVKLRDSDGNLVPLELVVVDLREDPGSDCSFLISGRLSSPDFKAGSRDPPNDHDERTKSQDDARHVTCAGRKSSDDTESAVHKALATDGFKFEYQPVVEMPSGRPCAAEALIRWRSAGLRSASISGLISTAERSGLIVPIGALAIHRIVRQLAQWAAGDISTCPGAVAINFSAQQIAKPGLAGLIEEALDRYGVPSERLIMELTERVMLDGSEGTSQALSELRRLGVRLVVDDFGTGYATMSYLSEVCFDGVKIDRSFVAGLPDHPRQRVIIGSVIDVAHKLGMSVTAEGVENRTQWDILCSLGCDLAQGYLVGRPSAPEEIPSIMAKESLLEHSWD